MSQSKSGNIEQAVRRVMDVPNECSFTSGRDHVPNAVCSDAQLVKKMAAFIEERHEQRADPSRPAAVIQDMKELLNCQSESCIFRRRDFIEFAKINNVHEVLNKYFKPEGPATSTALLSNFNIDDVLKQFEKKFANRKFVHIPFQMRDFDKIQSELATTDFVELFRTHNTFGCVLNTDYSHGKGIHWFCIFGERYPDGHIELEYFNSSGREPLAEVQNWLSEQKHRLARELKVPVQIKTSTGIRFQDDDHSCGVYSLCYIWLRLEQVPPSWFSEKTFNDRLMLRARRQLFRHEV
jgi:hypothetical protein